MDARSIAVRLFLAVAIAGAIFALLAVTVRVALDYRAEERAVESLFSAIEDRYVPAVEQSLFNFDTQQLTLLLEGIVLVPEIAYVEVIEMSTGAVVARDGLDDSSDAMVRTFPLTFQHNNELRQLGRLVVKTDEEARYERFRSRLVAGIVASVAQIALVALVLSIVVDKTIVRELRSVAAFVDSIRLGATEHAGAPRIRRKGRGGDEIDAIVTAVEEMNRRVTETYESLVGTQQKLRTALDERETLLRELYHRTKNNMQVIISMLHLRADRDVDDAAVSSIIADVEQRVYAMALVHQQLYRSNDLSRLELDAYLSELVDYIRQAETRVTITFRSADCADTGCPVSIDTAIPCGLAVTELVTNAIKHAFPANGGNDVTRGDRVEIFLRPDEAGGVQISVRDNGIGLAAGFDPRHDGMMGMQTVFVLVERQLDGAVYYTVPAEGGTECTIDLPLNDSVDRI